MKRTRLSALLLSIAFAALTAQAALAVGTPACTSIANTATVSYKVGTEDQTPVDGVATPFIVGNKIIPVVAVQDASPGVRAIQGATDIVLEFTVTNDGNKVQDYALSTVNLATGQTAWAGITDEVNAGAATAYVESGANAGYQAAEDTALFIDELAPNATKTVYVVVAGPVPTTTSNNENALYALIATTHRGGTAGGAIGALVVNGETGTCGEDTVFADLATSTGPNDDDLDGKDSDRSGLYVSASATVEVSKSSVVYSDPVNGIGAGAKAIPGAIVTYTITITNPAASTATVSGVSIADNLNNEIAVIGSLAFNTQFDDGTDTCAADEGIVVDNTCLTNTADLDAADFTANVVNVAGANLAPGASTIIKFQVTVQ